jgi:hypothetical protein
VGKQRVAAKPMLLASSKEAKKSRVFVAVNTYAALKLFFSAF